MRKGRHLILALIGAALFTWVIARVGLPTILQQVRAMAIALPILLILSLCRLLLQTSAWSMALKGEGLTVAPERLIGIRLASQSMGYLTFLGAVLSEPLKIKLLRTPVESTIKATLLDSGVYWFTSALVAIVGCLCAALLAIHGGHYLWTIVAVSLLTLILFLIARSKPILSGIVRALEDTVHPGLLVGKKSNAPYATIVCSSPLSSVECSGSTSRASCSLLQK